MWVEPGLDIGSPVSAVVVHDQMQRRLAGKLPIDASEEPQELLVPVTLMEVADDFACSRSSAANRVVVPLRL